MRTGLWYLQIDSNSGCVVMYKYILVHCWFTATTGVCIWRKPCLSVQ